MVSVKDVRTSRAIVIEVSLGEVTVDPVKCMFCLDREATESSLDGCVPVCDAPSCKAMALQFFIALDAMLGCRDGE